MKTKLLGLTLLCCGVLWVACGGPETPVQSAADQQGQVTGLSKDDQSKCEFNARPDREVRETAGPGSLVPNIRRVYAIVGAGEDRRRVLLCREVDTNLDGMKDVVRTYNDKGEKVNELSDSDYDGKIDTWVTFSGGRISKVELDKQGLGQPSEWRFYVGGNLSRAQRDTNKDGKADVWEIYANGRLERMGVDLDGDGRVDRWNRDEMLARAELEAEEREAEQEEQKKQKEGPEGGPEADDEDTSDGQAEAQESGTAG